MQKKKKNKIVILSPERPSSIPRSEILKAIKKVAANRRSKQKQVVVDGSK